MSRVVLSGSLKTAAQGNAEFEIRAADIRQLLQHLEQQCPSLKPLLDEGVTVSIDGQIYNDAWLEPIPEGCEIYILPRLSGG